MSHFSGYTNQPFHFCAAHNVTSVHSDSWHTPCQVLFLSRRKLAMCALQIKKMIYIVLHNNAHRETHPLTLLTFEEKNRKHNS